ncbi:MAG: adenylate cyclase regulatory domain-containing protein [Deltaproteobacteria bacterium]|nr:adenylate cyclase regulatory domain-containing protein [Deltaproteobacteria bacterium]
MADDDLAAIATRLAEHLLGPPAFSRREIATAAGLSIEQARRLWQAIGFPPVDDDERVFTQADVDVLRAVHSVIAERGASDQLILQQTRVVGQALARVADAQVSATVENAAIRHASEASDAVTVTAALRALEMQLPLFEHFVRHAWRRHLLAAALRLAAAPTDGEHAMAVGFADLAGFTALSDSLDAGELAATVDRFEALAYEHIVSGGGRVVKTIGDEVMFAVSEPRDAAAIALALVDAYARDSDLPDARIGMAFGPVVAWEGDLYGPTVNLASRLANFARPGTVLLGDSLGAALQGDHAFALRHLRGVKLKGLGAVRPWVLRRGASSPL